MQVSAQLFSAHRQYHEGQLTKRKVTTAGAACLPCMNRLETMQPAEEPSLRFVAALVCLLSVQCIHACSCLPAYSCRPPPSPQELVVANIHLAEAAVRVSRPSCVQVLVGLIASPASALLTVQLHGPSCAPSLRPVPEQLGLDRRLRVLPFSMRNWASPAAVRVRHAVAPAESCSCVTGALILTALLGPPCL